MNLKHVIAFSCFFLIYYACQAQTYKNPNAPVESRVEDLMQNLSLKEKVDYIGGYNSFYIRSIDRLGLPELKMSDGPVGVRTWGKTTAYPAGILTASTWNTSLVLKLGEALGEDARARGVHILLGPGLNIYRAPMCGRNFEYFGEDPFLAASMAKSYVNGVQSKNVIATVKHFAGNNQEWDRYDVSSDIDERTLHEIYLPAFKAAVKDAHAGAIMAAYNLLNGQWCTQNHYLLSDVLKTNWRFDGMVMSDWGATHDALNAASAGLDLEMPEGDNMNFVNFAQLIYSGELSVAQVDDKVRRILRNLFRFGFYDRPQLDNNIPLDDSLHAKVSLNLAREGIVLLKNADSLLPLDPSKIKSLAIIGPNADSYVAGGGSSYTDPYHYVSIRSGIQSLVGSKINVLFDSATVDPFSSAANSVFYTDKNATTRGLLGAYYPNLNFGSSTFYNRVDSIINYHWNNQSPINNVQPTQFSVRWSGFIKPTQTSDYDFIVRGDDGYRLYINNTLIINAWQDQAAFTSIANMHLSADSIYPVVLEYYQNLGLADITFGWQASEFTFGSAVQKAAKSDVAIVCVGFNSISEGEGADRSFGLPGRQDSLINAVARVNKKVIVVLNAGGNVDMNAWLSNCKALLHAWYPGQEGGTALAEILFGITNPSGKLPVSFEKKWADNPVFSNYYDNGSKHVNYAEGLLLGYRYYDTKLVNPLYPFGYGLSYTRFEYSNLVVKPDTINNNGTVYVSYQIKNIGGMAGSEISQVYIQPINSVVSRPFKELKAFNKVSLQPGETKNILIRLDSSAFSYYKTNIHDFGMEYASYKILIGASSRDIRLQKLVVLSDGSNQSSWKYQLFPANHASQVHPLESFKFIHDHPIYFDSNKSVNIKDSITGLMIDKLSYSEGSGTDTLTFKHSVALLAGRKYFIEIDSSAIVDFFNHSFQGFMGPGNWNFLVVPADAGKEFNDSIFEIYPNPAKDHITFHFNKQVLEIQKICIINAFGQCIDQIDGKQIVSDYSSYSCVHMANGLYFGELFTKDGILVRRFAVQK